MFTSGRWFGLSASAAPSQPTTASTPASPQQDLDRLASNQQNAPIHQESQSQSQSDYPSFQLPPHPPADHSQLQSPSASPSASASPSTHSAAHAHHTLAQFFDNANHGDHGDHTHNDRTHSHPHSPSARHSHLLPGHGDSTSDSLSESESESQSQSQSQSDVHETDSDDEDEDEDQDTPDEEDLLWKDWFLSLPGNEYLTNVPDTFIEDEFNLTGLAAMVPFFHESLDLILDRDSEDNVDPDLVESSAQLLYTLIHARWIITKAGLQAMLEKIENRVFGVCPRVFCFRYPLLPVGPFDLPGMGAVKLYCHSCQDTYHPQTNRFARLDGASIGSTFPHLMFLSFPDLHNHILELTRDPASPGKDSVFYVPKMFGFRVHEKSDTPDAPRAYWLRALPGSDRRSGKLVES